MHQDAHEFLNYLLDTIGDTLQAHQKAKRKLQDSIQRTLSASSSTSTLTPMLDEQSMVDASSTAAVAAIPPIDGSAFAGSDFDDEPIGEIVDVECFANTTGGTFVHDIFEGVIVNEMKCMNCETVSWYDRHCGMISIMHSTPLAIANGQRMVLIDPVAIVMCSTEETFLDLSVDVEQNTSLTACLKGFFGAELLRGANKFYCDVCCSLQEASKRYVSTASRRHLVPNDLMGFWLHCTGSRMRVKRLPKTLVIQLKRFKYIADQMGEVDMMSSLAGLGAPKKLPYRVAFPQELRLPHSVWVVAFVLDVHIVLWH
jgi:hypothetical protein